MLQTYSTCLYPRYQDTTTYAALMTAIEHPTVPYKFHKNFPTSSQQTVRRAMGYISSKFPGCITFEEATSSAGDYVLFQDQMKCSSELGRTDGEQDIALNR